MGKAREAWAAPCCTAGRRVAGCDLGREALLRLCLSFPGCYEDYPFHDENWAVVRHAGGGKIFACVYHRLGRLRINLKCDPMEADFLRSVYEGVEPGFHMNHQHWNTVTMGRDVPEDELVAMIRQSYALTKPKPKPRKRKQP